MGRARQLLDQGEAVKETVKGLVRPGTVAMLAALALVAQSEWQLALAVGWPPWIAWAAPVALDAYVWAAVRAVRGREVGWAVIVSSVSVLASHTVYATGWVWSSGVPGSGHLVWWLAGLCSSVPLLVAWRVHCLDGAARPRPRLPKTSAAPSPAAEPTRTEPPVARATPSSPRKKWTAKGAGADLARLGESLPTEVVMKRYGLSKRSAERALSEARSAEADEHPHRLLEVAR